MEEKIDAISMEEYVKSLSGSTQRTYRFGLKLFFEWKKADDVEYVTKTGAKRCEFDLKNFKKHLDEEEGYCPKSVKTYVGAIVSFLRTNGIEMSRSFWRDLKVPNRAMTQDKVPSKLELREIINKCDTCGTALFLFASSSGLRIGDILNIRTADVEAVLDQEQPCLKNRIVMEKTKDEVFVLFTKETAQAIKKWLEQRDEWLVWSLKHCSDRGIGEVDPKSDKLFPFSYTKAQNMWQRACKDAGFIVKDEKTNRFVFHLHSLRKYCYSQIEDKAGSDFAHAFLGHRQYLAEYSNDKQKAVVFKEYGNCVANLSVYENNEVEELRAKIRELEANMCKLNKERLFPNGVPSVIDADAPALGMMRQQKRIGYLYESK